nr:YolD-like family protein [Jeotgalicoccus sp. WY2]
MIKWAPFATMPEQFENVSRMKVEQAHVPAPNLTDELQQELELKLRELVGQNVILRYWQAGHEYIIECTIVNVDEWSEHVTAVKEGSVITVLFKDVYSVDEYKGLDVV